MRPLAIGLMIFGLMGIALVGVTSPATSINKVVIGVLSFQTSHFRDDLIEGNPGEWKKALMKELRRNTRVKLVDIRESCNLSDLKRHGYEQAEGYKNMYQLDMILHTYMLGPPPYISGAIGSRFYFSLIDLYTKEVREVSIEATAISVDLSLKGISKKLLVSKDLNRVLREKKKASGK